MGFEGNDVLSVNSQVLLNLNLLLGEEGMMHITRCINVHRSTTGIEIKRNRSILSPGRDKYSDSERGRGRKTTNFKD